MVVNEIPAFRRDACPQCRQMLRFFLMIRLPEQLFEIVSCELKYNYGKYRRKSQGPLTPFAVFQKERIVFRAVSGIGGNLICYIFVL